MPHLVHLRLDPRDQLRPQGRDAIRPLAGPALTALIFSALSAGLIAGCGPVNDPARSETPSASTSASAPTAVTPVQPASATPPAPSPEPEPSRQACSLTVDEQVHVQGPCLVYPFGDGGYTLNAWSEGKPKQSHFAVVTINGDGTARATWNAAPDDTRAGDPLGTVRLVEGCWVNERVRICGGAH
jgi:hypothetical protein